MPDTTLDWTQPEEILWECLESVPGVPELQIATMLSLSLGADHSYEARSIMWSLFKTLRPGRIIETGTNHGLTAAYMWKLGDTMSHPPHVQTFDIAASTLAPRIWQRLGMGDFITFTRGDSAVEVTMVGVAGTEFVLIDGDHSYEGAERDWLAIEPLLAARCVILCDNMDHVAGCGRFFASLKPLWFHPQLAVVVRGLSESEVQKILATYIQRMLPLWIASMTGKNAVEVRCHLAMIKQRIEEEVWSSADQHSIANACRRLSTLTQQKLMCRESHLMRISARYGIGTLSDARRTRTREAMPGWLHPWMSRAYRLIQRH